MKFTGGDNQEFTQYETLIHQIMMRNELNDGEGAYALSRKENNTSGYKFGGNQMDLSQNNFAQGVLEDILRTGRVNDSEISNILQTVKDRTKTLTAQQSEMINMLLSSDYGIQQINKIYPEEIKRKTAAVQERLANCLPQVKKIAENNLLVRSLLVAYQNEGHFDANSPLSTLLTTGNLVLNNTQITLDANNFTTGELVAKFNKLKTITTDVLFRDDSKRRYDNIKGVFEDFLKEQLVASLSLNNNMLGSERILPNLDPGHRKYTPDELEALALRAITGNDPPVLEKEYNLMQNGSTSTEKSSNYSSVQNAVAYVDTIKTYGFGLLQTLKDKKEEFDKVSAEPENTPNHAERVAAAEQAVTNVNNENITFQKNVETAMAWGQFTVSMATQLAHVTKHDEEANKIAFYGSTLLTAGLAAAQLYTTGDPRALLSLSNSLMGLTSGVPAPSPEQQMLNMIASNLQEIKQDLGEIKQEIAAIHTQIEHLSNQMESHLVTITRIGLEILKEVNKLAENIQHLELTHMLTTQEDRDLYTGYIGVETDLRHGTSLSPERAADINLIISTYTQRVAILKSTLATLEVATIDNFAKQIVSRAAIHDAKPAFGVLHSLHLFFRYVESLIVQRFQYDTKCVEDLVNLPIWQNGIKARITFLRRLQEQNGLNDFLKKVGTQSVCNALNEDISRAQHTLNQLRSLAYTNIFEQLFENMHEDFKSLIKTYSSHPYHNDDEGLNIYTSKTGDYRKNAIVPDKFNNVIKAEYQKNVPKSWDKNNIIPSKNDYPGRNTYNDIKPLPIVGQECWSTYEAEFQVNNNNVLLPNYNFNTTGDQIGELIPTINFRKEDNGFSYPNGYSFQIYFGYTTRKIEHREHHDRPDRLLRNNFIDTWTEIVKEPASGELIVEMHVVDKKTWDDILFQKINPEPHYDTDQKSLENIFNHVQAGEHFQKMENWKTVITALLDLFADDCKEKRDLIRAFENYYLDQKGFLTTLTNGKSVKWKKTWVSAEADFSPLIALVEKNYSNLTNVLKDFNLILTDFTNKRTFREINDLIQQLRGFILLFQSMKNVNDYSSPEYVDRLLSATLMEVSADEDQKLDTQWNISEGRWRAKCTREGTTRKFNALWSAPHESSTPNCPLQIFVTHNNEVTILRDTTANSNVKAVYSGKLDPAKKQVTGTAISYSGGTPKKFNWSAKIGDNTRMSAHAYDSNDSADLDVRSRSRFHFFNS